jgi:glutamine synthetase
MEAMDELKASDLFREALGQGFIDFMDMVKQSEITAYLSSVTGTDHLTNVTDWEHREYFELF